jgi:hypothetical protein
MLSGLDLGAWTLGALAPGLSACPFAHRATSALYDNSSSRAIYHSPPKKNLTSGSSGSIGSSYFSKKCTFFEKFAPPTLIFTNHSPKFLIGNMLPNSIFTHPRPQSPARDDMTIAPDKAVPQPQSGVKPKITSSLPRVARRASKASISGSPNPQSAIPTIR